MTMRRRNGMRKAVRWFAAIYLTLWLVTALFGVASVDRAVDRAFDREFAEGSRGLGPGSTPMPVIRIPFQRLPEPFHRLRDRRDVPFDVLRTPWRMRSPGLAVAPFLILDEAAWQSDALAGYGGRRVVFWFFGFSAWYPLKVYWVS